MKHILDPFRNAYTGKEGEDCPLYQDKHVRLCKASDGRASFTFSSSLLNASTNFWSPNRPKLASLINVLGYKRLQALIDNPITIAIAKTTTIIKSFFLADSSLSLTGIVGCHLDEFA